VATHDNVDAIDMTCNAVERVTGVAAEPVFQEIDRDCLIIELRLDPASTRSFPPSGLADNVERGAPEIEVLSAWCEPPAARTRNRRQCEVVLIDVPHSMPTAIGRAIIDGLPTSHWDEADRSWTLAVPAPGLLAFAVVGMAQRSGYSHRFDVVDADAILTGLAS
jgi:hypothetical protein